jgi:hypothetical protein
MKRALFSAVLGLALTAPAAMADGGQSIAGATGVIYGQQEFGNTANGAVAPGGCAADWAPKYRSWWALSVVAGDHITIDWEAQPATALNLFAVGTTDFTFEQVEPLTSDEPSDNGKSELTYTASQTGSMPLEFVADTGCNDAEVVGPYDFTSYVRHAVRLAIQRAPGLTAHSTVRVAVHSAAGTPISDPGLQVAIEIKRAGGAWRTVGTASPADGVAKVRLSIPRSYRHVRVSLRARASGANYVNETSSTRRRVKIF